MEAEFDAFFPRIQMKGSYKGDGRIDGLKFNSKGDFNFTFSKYKIPKQICTVFFKFSLNYYFIAGVRSTSKLAGIFVKRDGHKFLQLNSFDVSISMEDFKVAATGLFPDPELSRLTRIIE